jgi:hypothetical protein
MLQIALFCLDAANCPICLDAASCKLQHDSKISTSVIVGEAIGNA